MSSKTKKAEQYKDLKESDKGEILAVFTKHNKRNMLKNDNSVNDLF